MSLPSAKAELLAPGTTIGRYCLLQRLATGGMAELYLACAEGLAGFQRLVVVKHVLPHLARDPDFVKLFLNEARIAATLAHPNIVQVTDIGEAGGDYFYVMEFVHGRNARELLREGAQREGIPLDVAVTIVLGAAEALAHTHAAADVSGARLGLIHRDVSPANLLVSYEGGVKLTDFGIAKASEQNNDTIGGAMKGKVGYMSPEQCRGGKVDQRSDIFALGVVLFELSTCQRLFYGHNDFAVLNAVVAGEFDPPTERVPDYPPELEDIVMRALATAPEERYQTAEAFRDALQAFADERQLRTRNATVAAWMAEVFGVPEPPRVELRKHGAKSEPFPTLVVAAETEVQADAVEVALERPPETRNLLPWFGVGVAAAASLVGAVVMVQGPSDAGAVPAAEDVRPVASQPAALQPAEEPEPAQAEPEPEPVAVEPDVAAPEAAKVETKAPAASRSRRKPRKRSRKTKAKSKSKRDITELFPVD